MVKADKIIAISRYIETYIKDLAPTCYQKIILIPRGVDVDYFNPDSINEARLQRLRQKWKLVKDQPLILFPA